MKFHKTIPGPPLRHINHTNDPETSYLAAIATIPARGTQRYEFLKEYSFHQTQGLTGEEASNICGYIKAEGRKRCSELKAMGYLQERWTEDCELMKRPGETGKLAEVLFITPAGLDALREADKAAA